jgi:DNA-binding GntR family transcriptional regulator
VSSSSLEGRGLRYQKLSDEVAGLLQQMILNEELVSGQKITQDELAKKLGVSTMPIREALLKLAALGLVDAAPNRSFRVARSTKSDLRDSYWAHATFAGELARRACALKGPELVADLQAAMASYLQAAEMKDHERLMERYAQFSRVINLAADAPRLVFMLRTNLQFLPIRWFPLLDEWIPLAQRSHKLLIAAMKRQAPDAAHDITYTHIRQAGELLISHYEAAGRWAITSAL